MIAFKDNNDGYYEFYDDAPAEWYAHLTPTTLMVRVKTVEQIAAEITSAANALVISAYPELKQRKLMAISIKLLDKKLDGITLTTEEQSILQHNRAIDDWIASVRGIENQAIIDGVTVDAVVFPDVSTAP